MTLIRTSGLSFVATIFKITFGLVVNKLLAVYGGTSGIVLLGQFQNMQAAALGVATAGFGQGLTKYLAEFRHDVEKSASIFATAIKLVCLIVLVASISLFIFSDDIAVLLFYSNEYTIWVKGLSLSLIPASLGALLLAVLNGLGDIRRLTLVGVLSSTVGIALVLLFVPNMGISGAIASLLFLPFIVLIVVLWSLHKNKVFSWGWLRKGLNHEDSLKLGKFTLMALASAVSIPLSHMIIRNYLGETISMDAAGLWTGMWRVSEAYLLVITMTLSVYYLPKLSLLKKKSELIEELKHGHMMIIPLVVVSSLLVFVLRDWIILLLFTDGFLAMGDLFLWQLIGDVVKIACFLLGFILIAKGLATFFIVKEIVVSIMFVMFTYIFVDFAGLVGVTYAYVATYTANFLLLLLIVRHYFRNIHTEESACLE